MSLPGKQSTCEHLVAMQLSYLVHNKVYHLAWQNTPIMCIMNTMIQQVTVIVSVSALGLLTAVDRFSSNSTIIKCLVWLQRD